MLTFESLSEYEVRVIYHGDAGYHIKMTKISLNDRDESTHRLCLLVLDTKRNKLKSVANYSRFDRSK